MAVGPPSPVAFFCAQHCSQIVCVLIGLLAIYLVMPGAGEPLPLETPVAHAPAYTPRTFSSGPARPEDCTLSGEIYAASPVCHPDVRREWRRLASVPREDDSCRVDPKTGRIVCDLQIQCEGGLQSFHPNVMTKHTMEYDCSKCPGSQRFSCCHTCKMLQAQAGQGHFNVAGKSIQEVVCRNPGLDDCNDEFLRTLNPAGGVNCTQGADGTFECSQTEHCDLGMQQTHTKNLSYWCQVMPCDTCADNYAKAQCCAKCLESYCEGGLSFENRKVCRGCGMPPPR